MKRKYLLHNGMMNEICSPEISTSMEKIYKIQNWNKNILRLYEIYHLFIQNRRVNSRMYHVHEIFKPTIVYFKNNSFQHNIYKCNTIFITYSISKEVTIFS